MKSLQRPFCTSRDLGLPFFLGLAFGWGGAGGFVVAASTSIISITSIIGASLARLIGSQLLALRAMSLQPAKELM